MYQAVDVHGVEVEVDHVLKELCGRWRGSNSDSDWILELDGRLVCAEQGVDGGSGIEVRDALFAKELPDVVVVDLSETVVGAANRDNSPGL